jgi:hypothetical protein
MFGEKSGLAILVLNEATFGSPFFGVLYFRFCGYPCLLFRNNA